MAAVIYRAAASGSRVFCQAPTGIGKTISSLFPAVKAMGEKKLSHIFYLTAKTSTRAVAEEGFALMQQKGIGCATPTTAPTRGATTTGCRMSCLRCWDRRTPSPAR